jgi:hypothetical protein
MPIYCHLIDHLPAAEVCELGANSQTSAAGKLSIITSQLLKVIKNRIKMAEAITSK